MRHSTAISYPSIENLFNGCQGHPLVCLPPGTAQRQRNPEVKLLNAQHFIQLTFVDSCGWHKVRKAVEACKQKWSAYYDICIAKWHYSHITHHFLTWTSLCIPHNENLYQSYAAIRLLFFDYWLAITFWTVAWHSSIPVEYKQIKVKLGHGSHIPIHTIYISIMFARNTCKLDDKMPCQQRFATPQIRRV